MSAGVAGAVPAAPRVVAWDLPTRLFKWSLVALIALAWVSDKYGGATPGWHKANGYAVLVLVVFRALWGFFGGASARFSSFAPTPRKLAAYLRAARAGRPLHYLGHNPLGSLMVFALLAIVAAQAVTGLYSGDADRLFIEGPLAATVSDAAVVTATRAHRFIFDAILVLVAVHVAAVVYYDLVRREGLARAMVTGKKPAAAYADMAECAPARPFAALACLAAAAALVFGTILALGGRAFF
ncbi:cytochrome b/b6 domain-containing protein [Methylocella sp.]|uniref:cytochrome b/b6 domain-containing protein n=1 Tax=Methylocella sp. TaxID=1978226 RepID=UPI003782F0CD